MISPAITSNRSISSIKSPIFFCLTPVVTPTQVGLIQAAEFMKNPHGFLTSLRSTEASSKTMGEAPAEIWQVNDGFIYHSLMIYGL